MAELNRTEIKLQDIYAVLEEELAPCLFNEKQEWLPQP